MTVSTGKSLSEMLQEALGADLSKDIRDFAGTVEVSTESGNGFILMGNGKVVGAYYRDKAGTFKAADAVNRIAIASPSEHTSSRTVRYRVYSPAEFQTAMEIGEKRGLLLPQQEILLPGSDLSTVPFSGEQDDTEDQLARLSRILRQPGVIAVSAFFEGFAVRSLGKADFDQVAAMAEDLLRAGHRISSDMQLGPLDQLILETGQGKVIIAPYGDLYLCIYALPDANLGLIRVALHAIQQKEGQNEEQENPGVSA
jgi:predicted regulator of Ras-like GTPase activity (Roadblock/LC7/MglB family)